MSLRLEYIEPVCRYATVSFTVTTVRHSFVNHNQLGSFVNYFITSVIHYYYCHRLISQILQNEWLTKITKINRSIGVNGIFCQNLNSLLIIQNVKIATTIQLELFKFLLPFQFPGCKLSHANYFNLFALP